MHFLFYFPENIEYMLGIEFIILLVEVLNVSYTPNMPNRLYMGNVPADPSLPFNRFWLPSELNGWIWLVVHMFDIEFDYLILLKFSFVYFDSYHIIYYGISIYLQFLKWVPLHETYLF